MCAVNSLSRVFGKLPNSISKRNNHRNWDMGYNSCKYIDINTSNIPIYLCHFIRYAMQFLTTLLPAHSTYFLLYFPLVFMFLGFLLSTRFTRRLCRCLKYDLLMAPSKFLHWSHLLWPVGRKVWLKVWNSLSMEWIS